MRKPLGIPRTRREDTAIKKCENLRVGYAVRGHI